MSKKMYKKCLNLAKTIAKKRDWYVCQWCGKKKWDSKANIDASHIINEASDWRMAINPLNIIALCHTCHFNIRHKDPLRTAKWFHKKYPTLYNKLIKIQSKLPSKIPKGYRDEQYVLLKTTMENSK